MATRRWVGGARLQAQVTSWLFAGTWLATEHVTVTVGTKSITVLVNSTVIATILTNVEAALDALTAALYPELTEMTWSKDATHLIATGNTAGKSFLATVSTDSASGTIDAGATSTGTNTTANGGPNDVSVAANWGGTLPGNNDAMAIDPDATDDLLYNLDFFAANTGITINHTGSVRVGLPTINTDGGASYPEYRQQYLQTAGGTVNLGGVSGSQAFQGTSRFKHDAGSTACTWNVYLTAQGQDSNLEAALLKGTHASNVLNVSGQSQVGVAVFGGEVATLLTLKAANGGYVRCGGGVALWTVTNDGGTIEANSAIGTALNHGNFDGTTTVNGAGNVAQITADGGRIVYNAASTLGGNTVLRGAVIDAEQGFGAISCTNPVDCFDGGDVLDRNRRINFGGNLIIDYNGMDTPWGRNVRVTRSAVA